MSLLSNYLKGGKNPAPAAQNYIQNIPGMTSPYFAPYFNAGVNQLPSLEEQYGQLTEDPTAKYAQFGGGYSQSPGFKFALDQALQASRNAAAAGGMAGSPQHEQENMQVATGLANQDFNNYMDRIAKLYGVGLQGKQNLAAAGQQAGSSLADMIANTLAQSGNLAYRGQQEKNSAQNSLLGGLGRLGGAALSAFSPFSDIGSLFNGGMSSDMYGG